MPWSVRSCAKLGLYGYSHYDIIGRVAPYVPITSFEHPLENQMVSLNISNAITVTIMAVAGLALLKAAQKASGWNLGV